MSPWRSAGSNNNIMNSARTNDQPLSPWRAALAGIPSSEQPPSPWKETSASVSGTSSAVEEARSAMAKANGPFGSIKLALQRNSEQKKKKLLALERTRSRLEKAATILESVRDLMQSDECETNVETMLGIPASNGTVFTVL